MFYREDRELSRETKTVYRDDILRLIDRRMAEADGAREALWQDMLAAPERYRSQFLEMLGWPLTEKRPEAAPDMTETELAGKEGMVISRVTFTILDEVRMTGLLFRREGDTPRPLVICQHGGLGTPELIAGIYEDTGNYNDMLERILPYDVHVFAPQLLLWHEDYGVPFDRGDVDAKLRSVGSSITAIEVYGIQRILDYFEKQAYVSTFGMIGLSYGGFYTLFTAAADTRIRSALSCSYYCDRNGIGGFPDWRWRGAALRMQDAEIAALVYPRRLVIGMGDEDPLFPMDATRREFDRLVRMMGDSGTDWVDFAAFKGPHEFIRDDTFIQTVIDAL